jgi:hypothetical protein
MTTAIYKASTVNVVAMPAGTTPFFNIQGSATQTVRVRSIIISGPTLTAVAYLNILLTRHSTAASGGTPTDLVAIPIDSNYGATTLGALRVFTAAPTAGTEVGVLDSVRVLGQATTAAAAGLPVARVVLDFKDNPIILRGVAQGLCLRFAAAPASAVSLAVAVEWDEE